MIIGLHAQRQHLRQGRAADVFYLGVAMLFAMLVSGGAAVGLEFVAYRPLRRRNARR